MAAARRWLMVWWVASLLVAGAGARADNPDLIPDPAFSTEEVEQLVAPIALYPDSLIAQILMAATYPLEIVQAARWVKSNPGLEGKKLEQALASESWDPSVKALANFPDVLKRMSDNLDWTQDLGDAVLAQQQDVMDAIQRMRRYAYDAGNLKTSKEQKVVVQEKIIVVEPAADVVYVPAYNPTVVYGTYWRPATYAYPIYSYPSSYWYPPGYAASNIISFGLGMAVGAAIWGNWNWGYPNWRRGSVEINNNFNFNRNINTGNINIGNKVGGGRYSKWEHNVNHRGGVRYRDQSTRERYTARGGSRDVARIDRDVARGFDRSAKGDARRDRAGSREARPSTREARPSTRDLEASLGKARDRSGTPQGGPSTRDRAAAADKTRDRASARDRTASADKTRDRAPARDRSAGVKRDRPSQKADRSGGKTQTAFRSRGGGSFERAARKRGAESRGGGRAEGRRGGGGGGARAGGREGGGLRR